MAKWCNANPSRSPCKSSSLARRRQFDTAIGTIQVIVVNSGAVTCLRSSSNPLHPNLIRHMVACSSRGAEFLCVRSKRKNPGFSVAAREAGTSIFLGEHLGFEQEPRRTQHS